MAKHPSLTNTNLWKGGRRKRAGYIYILKPDHPFADCMGYVPEHRYIMEQKIGQFIKPDMKLIVHHKNGVKTDNRPENLEVLSNSQHTHSHHIGNARWKTRKRNNLGQFK